MCMAADEWLVWRKDNASKLLSDPSTHSKMIISWLIDNDINIVNLIDAKFPPKKHTRKKI